MERRSRRRGYRRLSELKSDWVGLDWVELDWTGTG